jgi:putative intracellular protease/amidase
MDKELKKGGAVYSERKVVVTENMITANGPESAKEVGIRIWETLKKEIQ